MFSDPNFDFEDELLPKHQHKISIRRSSKRAGRTHRRPTRLPASKATVVSVPVPVSVAEKSSQGKEPSHSTLTLDAKIQETEKLLEQPQTASMAALREKNIEIKKMALELDEARQECDALKRRLNRVETVSSRVSDKIEAMEKELAGRKDTIEESTETAKDRLNTLEDAATSSASAKRQHEECDESLAECLQKMLDRLAERMSSSEKKMSNYNPRCTSKIRRPWKSDRE